VILSDRSIREELAVGRIVIEPLDESAIQPSSIDVHLDRSFLVFLNHTRRVIDVKEDQRDLTQPVEIAEGDAFILHPGEFVLGSTLEHVTLPDNLVSRIEGKSSLARLGLLIHSSLPGSEPVMMLEGGVLTPCPIEDIVRKERRGFVVAFDPDTFQVGYHEITGWYEGPPDRIYEIELASGRTVRVTAGHNLFTVDPRGQLTKVRTHDLLPGARVAVPVRIPDPVGCDGVVRVADHVPDPAPGELMVSGTAVARAFGSQRATIASLLASEGIRHVTYYERRSQLPYRIARQLPGLLDGLGDGDFFGWRGGQNRVPAEITVDSEFAWLLGMYVAEGYRRRQQVVIANTVQGRLDRLADTLTALGLTFHRGPNAITVGSVAFSALLDWLGTGGRAPTKRVPPIVFGWPTPLVEAFIEGVVDGDGSFEGGRTSVWTTSRGLVGDLQVLFARLGRRSGSCRRPGRGNALPSWQVYAPDNEHKLLTSAPVPDRLLVELRRSTGCTQVELAKRAGFRHASDLCNIENRTGRVAVRRRTLERLRSALDSSGAASAGMKALDRLIDGDLAWDVVVAVHDTGQTEPIFDIEVRPNGRKIENFLAGNGGVFVSNTAGFIDPGFSGHITLELANVATLPITLYPGMKIGQISFVQMTTPADVPYGSSSLGSKYQGQRGPTPSRYFENFRSSE
jgi:deoxycytidine triphosphate deaminase